MEEFGVRKTGRLTTREWYDPVNKISHHIRNGLRELDTRGLKIVVAFAPAYRNISPALECILYIYIPSIRIRLPYTRTL